MQCLQLQGTRFLDPSFRMEYDYVPISVPLNIKKIFMELLLNTTEWNVDV